MSDSQVLQTDLPSKRLWSLDTLRGFDMFWIIGGSSIFHIIARNTEWGWADVINRQLEHVEWEGLQAMDMVFPLFMFISGVAIPYAQSSRRQKGATKTDIIRKVVIRALLLLILGLICNGILSINLHTLINLDWDRVRLNIDFRSAFQDFRWFSVLGQIGLAYLFASLIVLYTKSFMSRAAWLFGILLGYAAIQLFIPVPGIGAGVLTPEGCINGYIDRMIFNPDFLPGRLYGKVDGVQVFDPEGFLCIASATGITLMGALAGHALRRPDVSGIRKTWQLAVAGIVFLGIGLAIAPWYPPIKAAWTTTFNLQAGGISLLLLAAFYLVIDVWECRKWTFFFRVIGLNAITIYMAPRVIDFRHAADFLFTGTASLFAEAWQPMVITLAVITLKWLFLYFLYKKKIFLRV